jgi:ubiquinone biosynthesis protein UbiJ
MQSEWKEEFVALLQTEWQKMKKDAENDKNNEFLQIQEMLQRLEGKVDRLNARLTSLEREARRR